MKITNHEDGSRSFKFSLEEQVHGYDGTDPRAQALTTMANCTGGIYAMIADLLLANKGSLLGARSYVGFGSDSLSVILQLAMEAEESPFGQGCKKTARREYLSRKSRDGRASADEAYEFYLLECEANHLKPLSKQEVINNYYFPT